MLYKIICVLVIYLIWLMCREKQEIKYVYVAAPATYRIANFELMEQPDTYTCGPKSCEMFLKFHGKTVDFAKLRIAARTDLYGLTTPQAMIDCLNKFGLETEMCFGNLYYLKHLISCDNPPIVLICSSENSLHYLIGVGYTETTLIFADPGNGRFKEVTNEIFLTAWSYERDIDGLAFPNSTMKKALGYVGIKGNLLISKK